MACKTCVPNNAARTNEAQRIVRYGQQYGAERVRSCVGGAAVR